MRITRKKIIGCGGNAKFLNVKPGVKYTLVFNSVLVLFLDLEAVGYVLGVLDSVLMV